MIRERLQWVDLRHSQAHAVSHLTEERTKKTRRGAGELIRCLAVIAQLHRLREEKPSRSKRRLPHFNEAPRYASQSFLAFRAERLAVEIQKILYSLSLVCMEAVRLVM